MSPGLVWSCERQPRLVDQWHSESANSDSLGQRLQSVLVVISIPESCSKSVTDSIQAVRLDLK